MPLEKDFVIDLREIFFKPNLYAWAQQMNPNNSKKKHILSFIFIFLIINTTLSHASSEESEDIIALIEQRVAMVLQFKKSLVAEINQLKGASWGPDFPNEYGVKQIRYLIGRFYDLIEKIERDTSSEENGLKYWKELKSKKDRKIFKREIADNTTFILNKLYRIISDKGVIEQSEWQQTNKIVWREFCKENRDDLHWLDAVNILWQDAFNDIEKWMMALPREIQESYIDKLYVFKEIIDQKLDEFPLFSEEKLDFFDIFSEEDEY